MRHFIFLLFALLFWLPSSGSEAAARFAFCATTCTWDGTNQTMWGTASGGVGVPASVPGSGDTVTLDNATCVGGTTCTITVNTNVNVASITMGACTATTAGCILDFSANNNSVTIGSAGFNGSGVGTRTLNMGNNTWAITATAANPWQMTTTTSLTFNTNSSTIVLSGNTATLRTFNGGALTYNAVTVNTNTSGGVTVITGANTFAALTLNGQNFIQLSANQTVTTVTPTGTSSALLTLKSNADGTARTITYTNAITGAWAAVRDITFASAANATFTNSFDLGNNTISGGGALSITVPATGGGGGRCTGC